MKEWNLGCSIIDEQKGGVLVTIAVYCHIGIVVLSSVIKT